MGRSTFYAHYADKEDLLQGASEGLRRMIEEVGVGPASRRGVHPALSFCLPMLEHAAHMRPLYEAMVGRKGGDLLLSFVHDIWSDFIRSHCEPADELAVQAIAGAFGHTMRWWLESAPGLEPAEVDRRFRALFEGSLP